MAGCFLKENNNNQKYPTMITTPFKKLIIICSLLAVLTIVFTGCQSTKTETREVETSSQTTMDTGEKSISN